MKIGQCKQMKIAILFVGIVAVACNGVTAPNLEIAAQRNDVASIKKLVGSGTPVDATDKHGYTALHVAAGEGNDDAVKELLALGAKVDSRSELGETPLWDAANEGRISTVRLLLEHGATPNPANNEGHSLGDRIRSLDQVGEGKPSYKEILGLLGEHH